MGLGSYIHPPASPPNKVVQVATGLFRLPYTAVKKVVRGTQYVANTGITATQAMGDAYRRTTAARRAIAAQPATAARPVTATRPATAAQPAHEYRPSTREPVMSRTRIAAAEATKAKVGGVNKSKVKKPVVKPVKKVVKKPLVKPAKKKVVIRRK